MVRELIGASVGALFTSVTMSVKVAAALRLGEPLSLTNTVTVLVLGPWASVGDQLRTPLDGSMLQPAGAPAAKCQVKGCAGMSESRACKVSVNSAASGMT